MKIYCHAPQENWICDRFSHEWHANNSEISTNDPNKADIIWLLAGWCWQQIPYNVLAQKAVIITIHHIVPNKFNDDKVSEFIERDKFINAYHVPCDRTREQISKLTKKPIFVIPFWVNQNIWKKLPEEKEALREKHGIDTNCFLIGSFQRDTEGHDLKSPKLEKGPDLLCDAVEKLRDHYASMDREVKVLLAGWRRQYVMNRLKNANIQFYAELPPFEAINSFYNMLDLYLVAARYEGGPQAIVECATNKTPIISTDVGLAPDILHPDSIFKPGNVMKACPNAEYSYTKVSKMWMPNGFIEFISMAKKVINS